MFPLRYYCKEAFAPRYFPKVGFSSTIPDPPAGVDSEGVYLVNPDTGEEYYGRGVDTNRVIASMQKGISAATAVWLGYDTVAKLMALQVTLVTEDADGWNFSPFVAGDTLPAFELMAGSLLASVNSYTTAYCRAIGEALEIADGNPTPTWTESVTRYQNEIDAFMVERGAIGYTNTSIHGATASTGAAQQTTPRNVALAYSWLHYREPPRAIHNSYEYNLVADGGTESLRATTGVVAGIKTRSLVPLAKNGATGGVDSLATVAEMLNANRLICVIISDAAGNPSTDTTACLDQVVIDHPELTDPPPAYWSPTYMQSTIGGTGFEFPEDTLGNFFSDEAGITAAIVGGTVRRVNSQGPYSGFMLYKTSSNPPILREASGKYHLEFFAGHEGLRWDRSGGGYGVTNDDWMLITDRQPTLTATPFVGEISIGSDISTSSWLTIEPGNGNTDSPTVGALGDGLRAIAARSQAAVRKYSCVFSRADDINVQWQGTDAGGSDWIDGRHIPQGALAQDDSVELSFGRHTTGSAASLQYNLYRIILTDIYNPDHYWRAGQQTFGNAPASRWTNEPSTAQIFLESGSYTFTGQTINMLPGQKILLDPGSYTFTGQPVNLIAGLGISITPGSYTFTGQEVDLTPGPAISIDPGSYRMTGQEIRFNEGGRIDLESGSYRMTGQEIDFGLGGWLPVSTGANETWTAVDTGEDEAL